MAEVKLAGKGQVKQTSIWKLSERVVWDYS